MAKNNHKGGESDVLPSDIIESKAKLDSEASLPIARTRKQSLRLLSTPSPRGKAPKTPKVVTRICSRLTAFTN